EDVADTVPDGETARAEDDLTRARRLSLFDGLLEKKPAWDLVRELSGQTAADTFVLFDRNYLFRFASALANEGLQGNFPTAEDCRLENNREEGKEFVRQHYPSLAVAEVKQFSSIAEASEFLKATDDLWVLKGKGEGAATFLPDVDDAELAGKQIHK